MSQKKVHILVVDDDQIHINSVRKNLQQGNFEVNVTNSGDEAINYCKINSPDIILLDIMIPGIDGIETCVKLRSMPNSTESIICFVSARNEAYSQVAAYNAGADDYVIKPIKGDLLYLKVRALLKRSTLSCFNNQDKISHGITIDRDRYVVVKNGKDITLPKKEFELLELLSSQPGKVFTREEILNKVWGYMKSARTRTIDVHIKLLRNKVGKEYIKTVKGIGYKLER